MAPSITTSAAVHRVNTQSLPQKEKSRRSLIPSWATWTDDDG